MIMGVKRYLVVAARICSKSCRLGKMAVNVARLKHRSFFGKRAAIEVEGAFQTVFIKNAHKLDILLHSVIITQSERLGASAGKSHKCVFCCHNSISLIKQYKLMSLY